MTQHQTIKALVKLRLTAKKLLKLERRFRSLTQHGLIDATSRQEAQEHQLQLKFAIIGVGRAAYEVCRLVDDDGLRGAAMDAIGVNQAHRNTKDMARYGEKFASIVHVLKLESSATREDCCEIEAKPLSLCMDQAMFNAVRSNEKLAKAVHEDLDSMFGGAFGEYQPAPLSSRLAGLVG